MVCHLAPVHSIVSELEVILTWFNVVHLPSLRMGKKEHGTKIFRKNTVTDEFLYTMNT